MVHSRQIPEGYDATAREWAVMLEFQSIFKVGARETSEGDYAWSDVWRVCAAAHRALEQGKRDCLDACINVLRLASLDTSFYQEMLKSPTSSALCDGFSGFASSSPPIEVEGVLEQEHLAALLSNDVNLILVRQYAQSALCAALADKLDDLPTTVWTYGKDQSQISTDVFTIGVPAQTSTSEHSRQRYREQDFEIVRGLSQPYLSPLDKFRLDLDALSPHGATVRGGADGHRRLAGIVRIYKPERSTQTAADGQSVSARGEEGYLHIDCLQEKDASMYSFNIYLDTPSEGGELTLYNIAPPVFDERKPLQMLFEFFRNFETYESTLASLYSMHTADADVHARLSKSLPIPITIKPEPGDLILINPGVPHAVRDLPSGRRISIQGFLKVVPEAPIRLVA